MTTRLLIDERPKPCTLAVHAAAEGGSIVFCLAEGPTCTAVAQRLGIPVSSLAKWVRQARIDRGPRHCCWDDAVVESLFPPSSTN